MDDLVKIQQILNSFKQLENGGWASSCHDDKAFTGIPLAQFYSFCLHDDSSFVSALSIDRFLENIASYKDIPTHLLDPIVMSSVVADLTIEVNKTKNKAQEQHLANSLSLYMSLTKTGQHYFDAALGQGFAFVAILYPENKECARFTVRPAIITADEIMSLEKLKEFAFEIAKMDKKAGHRERFRYLKHEFN